MIITKTIYFHTFYIMNKFLQNSKQTFSSVCFKKHQIQSHKISRTQSSNKISIKIQYISKYLNYFILTNILNNKKVKKSKEEQIDEQNNGKISYIFNYNFEGDFDGVERQMKQFKYCVVVVDLEKMTIEDAIGQFYEFIHRQTVEDIHSLQINISSFSTAGLESLSQQFTIYVSKMHHCLYQYEEEKEKMFYEENWNQKQILFIESQIQKFYGSYQKFKKKRQYLQFTFIREEKNQTFFDIFNDTNREILVNKDQMIINNSLNYYLICREREKVSRQLQKSNKLFVLPKCKRIIDMLSVDPWIIIATTDYIIFLHNQKTMEKFRLQQKQDIQPTKIIHLKQDFSYKENKKKILILSKNKSLISYTLTDNGVSPGQRFHLPFVYPYCLVQIMKKDKNILAFAGRDLQNSSNILHSNQNLSSKRRIYLLHNIFKGDIHNKSQIIRYEESIKLFKINDVKLRKLPIRQMIYQRQNNVLICCWHHNIYVLSLSKKQVVVEVALKAEIQRMSFLPFIFNSFNVVIMTKDGQLIRVGFEKCGQQIGAEVVQMKEKDVKDFVIMKRKDNKKYEFMIAQQLSLSSYDYLKQQSEVVLNEAKHEKEALINHISFDGQGIAFLLDLDHSIQVKYIQL